MERRLSESDWKTFRRRVPEWRDRFLKAKNEEIVHLLTDDRKTPTERFWDAKQRMDEDADLLVELLDGHSRSRMDMYLILMYGHAFISDDDLAEFSQELQQRVRGKRS